MVEVNELVTPRLAMEQIVEIQEKLEDGEDFAELAKEYSDDVSTANIGGDMGWFPPQAYGERVFQALQGLEAGETSQPFQTGSGWHIVEFLGKRETDRTEEAIRNEARDKIMRQKAQQEIEKVLRQFRDEAFVEIRLPGHENDAG
jgi:peptidyl-prolyl cis-trans isomerase SurA